MANISKFTEEVFVLFEIFFISILWVYYLIRGGCRNKTANLPGETRNVHETKNTHHISSPQFDIVQMQLAFFRWISLGRGESRIEIEWRFGKGVKQWDIYWCDDAISMLIWWRSLSMSVGRAGGPVMRSNESVRRYRSLTKWWQLLKKRNKKKTKSLNNRNERFSKFVEMIHLLLSRLAFEWQEISIGCIE